MTVVEQARRSVRDLRGDLGRWWHEEGVGRAAAGAWQLAGVTAVVVALKWYVSVLSLTELMTLWFCAVVMVLALAARWIGHRWVSLSRLVYAVTVVWAWVVAAPYAAGAWVLLGNPKSLMDQRITPVHDARMVTAQAVGALILFWMVLRSGRHPASEGAAVTAAVLGRASVAAAEHEFPAERVDEATARHEAAHAMVWSALGGRVHKIELRPDYRSGVNARVVSSFDGPTPAQLWVAMCGGLAGMVSDYEHDTMDGGASSDISEAYMRAAALVAFDDRPDGFDGELTISALVTAASGRARALLDEHRDAHEALTAALVAAGPQVLLGRQVDELLAGCGISNGVDRAATSSVTATPVQGRR